MAFRLRNSVILVKVEATPGTPVIPSAGSDAVKVGDISVSLENDIITTNEVSGSLDEAPPIAGGIKAKLSFKVYLKGNGTPWTAFDLDEVLQICGLQKTATNTAIPAALEACAAGGSTTAAVLGTSAGTTAQQYRGMPINFTGTVAGPSFISDYTAGKSATLTDTMSGAIAATSSYQIPQNVLYRPASSSLVAATIYVYADQLQYIFAGCRASCKFSGPTAKVPYLDITVDGMYVSRADVAGPPAATYDGTLAPVFKGAVCTLNRLPLALSNLSIDIGNNVVFSENPNAAQGFDAPDIMSRKISGSMDPIHTSIATRDTVADLAAGTSRILHARWGTATGNRVAITAPAAIITKATPGDRNGMIIESIDFALPSADSGFFLCFY
jgi:hypothetical protein